MAASLAERMHAELGCLDLLLSLRIKGKRRKEAPR
jgi:hypothetical protein